MVGWDVILRKSIHTYPEEYPNEDYPHPFQLNWVGNPHLLFTGEKSFTSLLAEIQLISEKSLTNLIMNIPLIIREQT